MTEDKKQKKFMKEYKKLFMELIPIVENKNPRLVVTVLFTAALQAIDALIDPRDALDDIIKQLEKIKEKKYE